MKITSEMIEKAKAWAEEHEYDCEHPYMGIRVQEQEFVIGEIDHISHEWDDFTDTGVELGGLCVCNLDIVGKHGAPIYYGDHAALIIGDLVNYGEDYGELILENCEVVLILA